MSQYWRCPNCGATLAKPGGGYPAGALVVGSVRCGNCNAEVSAGAVHAGNYDVAAGQSSTKKKWQFWK